MERDGGPMERPRILRVDLNVLGLTTLGSGARRAVPLAPWRGSSEGVDRVGSFSGTALAIALLHEHEVSSPGAPAPLVIAIGECVRRVLPTAARATVASRSPLTGLLAEGQVGSDLGRRLARVADALVLEGRTAVPGAVLLVSADGDGRACVELHSFPELRGADPAAVHRRTTAALGPCATLRTGRAGASGVPFAGLAAGDEVPSFVGRGGLGAVLGRLGLSAIAVRAAPVEAEHPGDLAGIRRLLLRSPRLRARAQGGTLEAGAALAAAGGLRGDVVAWAAELSGDLRSRNGCDGCPNPCGLVFERGFPGEESRSQGGRFGALYALGPNLGLPRAEDTLALLAACDAAALDAIETGAVLGLLARDRGRLGDRDTMLGWIEDLALRRGEGERLAQGALALARELGLDGGLRHVRGQSARPESSAEGNLAAVLGACVGARGSDPMRTFPFLADADPARLRRLLAPIPLPREAEDPRSPSGKGRIVWWHENLMAAVDATGFCAFSAAGLLADGVCDLDELARTIAPAGLEPRTGRGLLAAGASIVAVAFDLARRYRDGLVEELPPWARAALESPGMWPEYAAMRGLDEHGGPSPETWSRLGLTSILEIGEDAAGTSEGGESLRSPAEHPQRKSGRVHLRCAGPLARAIGECLAVDLDLPARLREVLAAAARDRPQGGRYLIHDGEAVPAAYRVSLRILPDDLVQDGDELDLVVALGGG